MQIDDDRDQIFKALGHKFQPGDIVAAKGTGAATGEQWGFEQPPMRWVVVHQLAARDPNGVTIQYACRGVSRSGGVTDTVTRFYEWELEASEAFQVRKKD